MVVWALFVPSTSGAAAASKRPVVLSVSASRSVVPASGGRVTVTARTAFASTCTFSAIGLSAIHATCSGGSAGEVISFAPNTASTERVWTIYVIGKGAGGRTSRWAHVTIVQYAPVPTQGSTTTVTTTTRLSRSS